MPETDKYAPKNLIDLPTVVITAFYILIWMLWLGVSGSYVYSGTGEECSITYIDPGSDRLLIYKNPEPFPFSSISKVEGSMKMDETMPARAKKRSKTLSRQKNSTSLIGKQIQ
ncbi:hypothetical protein BVX97_05775, partial [bacterium E08(2017)]